ncbi:MAG: (d)CMP kinase [Bacteroidaceae bacterium]|nr:(d)CMP kinase [Bacteroidaceae bacterium]
MSKIIVAIDGHSSCGKSTMAKALARAVGYIYVDTGAMYRCVTLYALRNRLIEQGRIYEFALLQHIRSGFIKISFQLDPETNQPLACLNGEVVEQEIRGMEVSNNVSPIAALPFVRTFLVAQQQAMGREKGIVMDGRDIATVVFPQAELKVFVTASAEVRAQRRFLELQEKGDTTTTFDEVLRNVQERDYIDSHREVAPLKPAEDSLILDNSNLTREQQNEWLLTQFHQRANQ